ncbi:MAG: cytochrome c3 family protein [Deltaproteobacteria bacterium]|nr:cytochrome c3 family protein [Deltaproteobacteria bacterium]
MKRELLVTVLLAGLVVLAVSVFHAGASSAAGGVYQADAPKDGIVLTAKPGNVTYNHSKHAAVACDKCHHKPDGDNKHAKCSKCHTAASTPTAKDAFHKNCSGCHKEALAKDAALAGKVPTKCNECHKK